MSNNICGDEDKIAKKIKQRQLQMLVHSYIYYRLDQNILSDNQWSRWAVELANLQETYPELAKQSKWYEAFKNWDGSTGAFLPLEDEWVSAQATYMLRIQDKTVKPKPYIAGVYGSSNKKVAPKIKTKSNRLF